MLIEHDWVLERLYREVRIPSEVLAELSTQAAPPSVRAWAEAPPPWLRVAKRDGPLPDLDLDLGETAAICLAREHPGTLLLIDERDGRRVAADRFHLSITGTLGVLVDASSSDLIRLPDAFLRLQKTNFRASKQLYEQLLAAANRRAEET